MEPYPTVGDIWEWDENDKPLLLLELDSNEGDGLMFFCLDLKNNQRYYMSFTPNIMDLWSKLA